MQSIANGLVLFIALLKPIFFGLAAVLFVVFAIDWLVRTRRINAFSGVARFYRRTVDPLVAPVERAVVRAGGLPSAAPWWALVAAVLGGILVITALQYLAGMLYVAASAAGAGPSGLLRLLVAWTIGLLQIALLVRVIASWFRISEYSKWIRWAVLLTEPILRPLRAIIPSLGMIDMTPLVAWFLLSLIRGLVL
ncbi:MAG: YggT family protein [Gemmatimonadaceae bacterium]